MRLLALPIVGLVLVGAFLAIAGLTSPSGYRGAPASAATLILVNSTSDEEFPLDGGCTLRAAIKASNIDGLGGWCVDAGSGIDGIRFAIDPPVINVTTSLPAITDPVTLGNPTSKVELRGPGALSGVNALSLVGVSGSTVRNMVINGFGTGINISDGTNITIRSNYIGTNAAGTAAAPNQYGIRAVDAGVQIGGTNGLTPGGACTGDCNLIGGNNLYGIRLEDGSSSVHGNLIGTDISGLATLGNDYGISLRNSSSVIGGPSAGNVISGNQRGISVVATFDTTQGSLIQGNIIGANASGTAPLSNAQYGIEATFGNDDYPLTIGGAAPGTGNVISGNTGAGIQLFTADEVAIYGNLIGTEVDGAGAIPNGSAGVLLSSSTHSNVIGGINPGEGNVIANNAQSGVMVGIFNYYNQIRGNSIHDNGGKGISEPDSQNGFAFTPSISGVGPAMGTACANCIVDIYSDGSDEGRVYEGTTTADGFGNWIFNGPLTGPNVTATATTANSSTSEFSAAVALPATPTPTPLTTPSNTPSPIPTPTLTPTPTSTPAPTPTPTTTPTPGGQTPTPTHAGPTSTVTTTPTLSTTPTLAGQGVAWGDNNCSGAADPVDALLALRHDAGLSTNTGECPAMGTQVDVVIAALRLWGDVDCSEAVDPVDALKLLRFDAGLSLSQGAGCPEIGIEVLISEA